GQSGRCTFPPLTQSRDKPVLTGFVLLGLGAHLFWSLLPNASAERNRQAAAVNHKPGGGDHGEAAEAATRQVDNNPSTESDDGCAPRNCEDRPEGSTSCLERRSQDQSETQERIGQACDNKVALGENVNLGNVREQVDPDVRQRNAEYSNAAR